MKQQELKTNEVEAMKLEHQHVLTTYQFLWIAILTFSFSITLAAITGALKLPSDIPNWAVIALVALFDAVFYIVSDKTLGKKLRSIQDALRKNKMYLAAATPIVGNLTADQLTTLVGIAFIFGMIFVLAKLFAK